MFIGKSGINQSILTNFILDVNKGFRNVKNFFFLY